MTVERQGLSLVAWNRGAVLEDRFIDRIAEADGCSASAVGRTESGCHPLGPLLSGDSATRDRDERNACPQPRPSVRRNRRANMASCSAATFCFSTVFCEGNELWKCIQNKVTRRVALGTIATGLAGATVVAVVLKRRHAAVVDGTKGVNSPTRRER